jgi:hypothetical protein
VQTTASEKYLLTDGHGMELEAVIQYFPALLYNPKDTLHIFPHTLQIGGKVSFH